MSQCVTMSFNQFFEMERGNLSLQEIIKGNENKANYEYLDHVAGQIIKNEKLRRCVVTLIATSMMSVKAFAEDTSTAAAMGKVSVASGKIITLLQFSIGKVCIIACILEIGKSIISKQREQIVQIGMKYFMVYFVIKILPWLFKLIDEIFS